MTPNEILTDCLRHLEGTVCVKSWGETGIFYNPDQKLKRGVYILTIKEGKRYKLESGQGACLPRQFGRQEGYFYQYVRFDSQKAGQGTGGGYGR